MSLRTALFWTHLVAGIVAGTVVFIMSFTGAALSLQPQILAWAEHDLRVVTPPSADASWLGPDALIERVHQQRAGVAVTGLTLEYGAGQAAAVTMRSADAPAPPGPTQQTTVYVNPYSGAIVGEADPASGWRRFFRVNTDWHRYLSLAGESRVTGRWITGVSNALFLFLAISGLILWIPRVWTSPAVRAVLVFRGGLSGKARDFNWHNVIGVWSAAVLIVLTFTALGISFPKTYDVIYSVTGIERPPTPQAPQGAPQRGEAQRSGPRETREEGQRPNGPREEGQRAAAREAAPVAAIAGLDRLWHEAEGKLPTWKSIAMRLPARSGQPVTFTMNDRARLNPMARSTLTMDAATGTVVRWEPYESLMTGQRLRTWMRFGHTGELWGLPGQIIAGLASAGACVLVYTGFALAVRRFAAWRDRRQKQARRELERERPAA
jgi:uncharacterized iron-regulated membrane protein